MVDVASTCFASLDDGLLVALVGHMRARLVLLHLKRCIPQSSRTCSMTFLLQLRREWKNLSSCCRRLCALVGPPHTQILLRVTASRWRS
jgi:hypothetical protein